VVLPEGRRTFSLLPDLLAAKLPDLLESIEDTIATAFSIKSLRDEFRCASGSNKSAGRISRSRNDLQRLGCRREGNAGSQARRGLFYQLENLL
jgi:hypothetical protein